LGSTETLHLGRGVVAFLTERCKEQSEKQKEMYKGRKQRERNEKIRNINKGKISLSYLSKAKELSTFNMVSCSTFATLLWI
jgi:hypothetical protein